MKTVILLLTLILLLFSCKKESSYSSKDYICNGSNHVINITYYKDGVLQSDKTINDLLNNSCNLVYQSSGFGNGGSNYLNGTVNMDSAIVLFDKNVDAIHYGINTVGLNSNAITFGSPRNIFGGASTGGWVHRIISQTKYFIEDELKYVFIEQDYLDAKNK